VTGSSAVGGLGLLCANLDICSVDAFDVARAGYTSPSEEVHMLALMTPVLEAGKDIGDPVASSISTVQVVSILIGTLIPILVALVTRSTAPAGVKAVVNLALSAVTAFLTEYINSTNFVWQQALLTTVMTFVVSVATYYGLWKPTNVAGSGSAAARAVTG
jgi:hypothetical protein